MNPRIFVKNNNNHIRIYVINLVTNVRYHNKKLIIRCVLGTPLFQATRISRQV